MSTSSSVTDFFNHIATTYQRRLDGTRPFLSYFFSKRLQLATAGLSLSHRNILDVGAGTGALFDYLQQQAIPNHYFACDLADQMLVHSRIPIEKRFVGSIQQLPDTLDAFDYIFFLGVSSYMSIKAFRLDLLEAAVRLHKKGQIVVSFTHQGGLDYRLRSILHRLFPKGARSKRVITQAFQIQAYTPTEVLELASTHFQISTIRWLPPTIPGLHHLSPTLAVYLSKFLDRHLSLPFLQQLLSTDFIVILEKH